MAINFPDSPGIGTVFTDTTSGFSYEWTGTLWKSFTGNVVSNIRILDDISGGFDTAETVFNLTVDGAAVNPVNAQQLELHVNDVQQAPGVDYTISGSTVVFTSAPTNGHSFFGKVLGTALSLNTVADGSSGDGLTGISTNFVSAIGIQSGGTVIGAGITQLNFVGIHSVSQSANGTVNVDIPTDELVVGVLTAGTAGAGKTSYLENATLEVYSEKLINVGNLGGSYTYNLADGNWFKATLDQTCTFTFDYTNAPSQVYSFVIELKNGSGGPFSITWPASVEWSAGVTPTRTTTDGRTDIWSFITSDGGTNWLGNLNVVNYNV